MVNWCEHGYDKDNTCPYCSPIKLNERMNWKDKEIAKLNDEIESLRQQLAKPVVELELVDALREMVDAFKHMQTAFNDYVFDKARQAIAAYDALEK